MLYQYLLDDVARKQPQPGAAAAEVEYVESPTGEMVPQVNYKVGLFRTKSTPKRTQGSNTPVGVSAGHGLGGKSTTAFPYPVGPHAPGGTITGEDHLDGEGVTDSARQTRFGAFDPNRASSVGTSTKRLTF